MRAVLPLIEQHRSKIEDLCRRFGVERLELFGSGARGDFDPARSDLDFFVSFGERDWKGSAARYFGLLHGLEDLLRRPVDLVELPAVESRLFLAVASQHRELIYADRIAKAS